MENHIVCPSCNGQSIEEIGPIPAVDIFAGQILTTLMSGFVLYCCRDCDLRFKYPRIEENELRKLYTQVNLDNWQYVPKKRMDWEFAGVWIRDGFLQAKILDVGCFDGGFFNLLPPTYKFYGIEVNSQAAEKARLNGVKIIASDITSLVGCPSGEFDVITVFDVIEHVVDPSAFLREAIRVVRPGGWIIVSTGNIFSRSWRLMGSHYYYAANAEHVSFISPQWCESHSRKLGVVLEEVREYSHLPSSSFLLKKKQLILNLIYRFAPAAFLLLRQLGLSNKDVKSHPELLYHPPNWMSARDHFIVKFRKL